MNAGAHAPDDPRPAAGQGRREEVHTNGKCDDAWLDKISNRPNVKPLLDGVTAILSLLRKGGNGRDAPIEQVAQMRRLLCHEYSKNDAPFDMVSPNSSAVPRCIAMVFMFGKPLVYYCDADNLIRMLAVSRPDRKERTILAIHSIFEKAAACKASVAIFFALGICAEVETMHWEVRTIRKTGKGRIKDGELMFSSVDLEPREVGCTGESEHWDDALFQLLRRRMLKEAVPICLDVSAEACPTISRCLSREDLFEMCEMLKTQRVKLLSTHKREMEQVRADHLQEMHNVVEELAQDKAKIELLLDDERAGRAKAVSKVAEQAARSEESIHARVKLMEDEYAKMKEQAVADKQRAMHAKALVEGMKLEQKEAQAKSKARESALEAQVKKMGQDQTRSVVERSHMMSELKKKHAAEMKDLRKEVSDAEKKLAGQRAAAKAVSASAEEARKRALALEQALETRNSIGHGYQRVALALLRLAGVRHAEALELQEARCAEVREERETVKRQRKENMVAAAKECALLRAEVESLRVELQVSIDACAKANEEVATLQAQAAPDLSKDVEKLEAEVCQLATEAKESSKKAKKDDHMISELQKLRVSLERRLVDAEHEVARLKREAHAASAAAAAATATAAAAAVPLVECESPVSTSVGAADSPPQPQPQPHFVGSPFPTQPWVKDDAFEGLVSTMYSTLSNILATARAAPGHRRVADDLQIKNDMLLAELRTKNDMLISMTSGMPPPCANGFIGGAYHHANNGVGNGGSNNSSSNNGSSNNGYARAGGGGRMGGHGKHHQQQQR